jgi:hypothetical protein
VTQVNLKVATFVYDEPALAALENSLSAERLTPYLDLAEKDRAYAIRLYEWNTRISESLYSLTQGLEITLRNRVNRVLCEAFAQENWWDICALATKQVSDIDEATKRIYYDGYDPVPNRIVAELMFGFWVSLFGTDYAQQVFDKHLWKCFPARRMGRKHVAKTLRKVRFLRNRVAHHESVIGKVGQERDLRKDVQSIIQLIYSICPITAKWVTANSSFDYQYDNRPTKPPIAELFPETTPHSRS